MGDITTNEHEANPTYTEIKNTIPVAYKSDIKSALKAKSGDVKKNWKIISGTFLCFSRLSSVDF